MLHESRRKPFNIFFCRPNTLKTGEHFRYIQVYQCVCLTDIDSTCVAISVHVHIVGWCKMVPLIVWNVRGYLGTCKSCLRGFFFLRIPLYVIVPAKNALVPGVNFVIDTPIWNYIYSVHKFSSSDSLEEKKIFA